MTITAKLLGMFVLRLWKALCEYRFLFLPNIGFASGDWKSYVLLVIDLPGQMAPISNKNGQHLKAMVYFR